MKFTIQILKTWLPLALLLITAVFLRTNKLEGKLTFEWDQARDYEAVAQMVKTGKPPLLGPIVRGDTGGFYLGPLYYYLITPVYLLSNGNPLALSVVSIGADVLLVIFFYLFMQKLVGLYGALFTSIIWVFSPLIISNSYTAWNVTLIPLWMLAYLIYSKKLSQGSNFKDLWIFTFLSALTTNIHLSLMPIVALMLLFRYRKYLKLAGKQYLKLLAALLLPVSTIIIHDLTHNFENTILLKRFLFGTASKSANLIEIIGLIIEKFGYTIGRLITGEPYTLLGWGVVIISILITLFYTRKERYIRDSYLMIFAILFSLLVYRDADFAEYYFIPTFIPILILIGFSLKKVFSLLPYFIPVFLLFLTLYYYFPLGLSVRAKDISPYSLTVKKEVVNEIKQLGYPIEFRTVLPRERNTGFEYLLSNQGVVSDPNAARKAYVYEAKNLEVIAPEDARSIILDKPIKAFKIIIFSN